MGRRHKPPHRFYPLDQSPLYHCRSRKRLAALLGESLSTLEDLAAGDSEYTVFPVQLRGKSRVIQKPVGRRERVHLRLFHLLRRIQPPEYLHSGIVGRSNVTNARSHIGHHPLHKLDIKAFYESTNRGHVYHAFRNIMQCSPDVAGLLAGLGTYQDHVPTGSPVSQQLAFWGLRPVLDSFAELCADRNVTLSVYVDDITISGNAASQGLLFELKHLLSARGLAYHKETSYRAKQPKIVTGVVVTQDSIRVRNRHHKRIYEDIYHLTGEEPHLYDIEALERLRGYIAAAAQIDPSIKVVSSRITSYLYN